MGQQTSPADRPPVPVRARRFASVTFAALSAVMALLTASAIVMWTSQHHVSTGAQADSLFVGTQNAFDSDLTAPTNQVTTATVTNVGTSAVTITDIQFALTQPSGDNVPEALAASDSATTSPAPPTVPLEIFPGENCKGAVLQPKTDCMVSVRYTSPGQAFTGQIIVTTADGSQRFGALGASPGFDNSIVADPYVVDFGTLPVGQTSPPQTVTIGASLDGATWNVVGVSVVDTVPTPGDRADYRITADGCTGQELNVPNQNGDAIPAAVAPGPVAVPSCTIQVTFTPGASGPRPAFLSVSYCGSPSVGTIGGVFAPAAVAPSSGPPPVDPNVFCPDGDNPASNHQIIALNGAGQAPSPPPTTTTTPPPPTTTTTTTPPPTTPTFTPTVTALPPVSPASRTTEVSGTGFPANAPVTFALVALNTAANANLSGLPNAVTTTTDGGGNFTDKVMLIMPHTQPGLYEILAQAQSGATLVTATVNFLVEPGIQEPPKFAFRH